MAEFEIIAFDPSMFAKRIYSNHLFKAVISLKHAPIGTCVRFSMGKCTLRCPQTNAHTYAKRLQFKICTTIRDGYLFITKRENLTQLHSNDDDILTLPVVVKQ